MKLGPLNISWKQPSATILAASDARKMADAGNPKSQIENPKSPTGLPGTPIFSGFLRDFGEYNPQLEGLTAVRTYEKMRRSDAQVAATLLACELPIRAANWDVHPASDSPADREIAAFVRENFFDGLEYTSPSGVRTSQCWDDVLRNALLMLAFGASAHEEIYAIDGDRCAWRAWRRACR